MTGHDARCSTCGTTWTCYCIPGQHGGLEACLFHEKECDTCALLRLDREPDRDYLGDDGEPMTCGDCGRAIFYSFTDEKYHHDTEPERGCFLIPAETQEVTP